MKKGQLTKYEKFYIQENPDNLTIHELAKELDRTPTIVGKYFMKQQQQTEDTQEPEPQTKKPEAEMFKLMGRHKRNNQNVATVMTKSASELADATRPERIATKNKLSSAIHKPIR
jgi:hypothetical protein